MRLIARIGTSLEHLEREPRLSDSHEAHEKLLIGASLVAALAPTTPAHAYYLRDCLRGAPCPGFYGPTPRYYGPPRRYYGPSPYYGPPRYYGPAPDYSPPRRYYGPSGYYYVEFCFGHPAEPGVPILRFLDRLRGFAHAPDSPGRYPSIA